MKLKAIHCYQYVRFQGKNENFITASKEKGMEDLQLTMLPEGVVSVKTAADHILVFPTNIAYAVPFDEKNKDIKVANRGALLDNDPTTPAKKK